MCHWPTSVVKRCPESMASWLLAFTASGHPTESVHKPSQNSQIYLPKVQKIGTLFLEDFKPFNQKTHKSMYLSWNDKRGPQNTKKLDDMPFENEDAANSAHQMGCRFQSQKKIDQIDPLMRRNMRRILFKYAQVAFLTHFKHFSGSWSFLLPLRLKFLRAHKTN